MNRLSYSWTIGGKEGFPFLLSSPGSTSFTSLFLVIFLVSYVPLAVGLRSKCFRRAFRPLEAFFAFWLRKNWGERNTDESSNFFRPPQFSRGQKSEKCIERAESLTETLATQDNYQSAHRLHIFIIMSETRTHTQ